MILHIRIAREYMRVEEGAIIPIGLLLRLGNRDVVWGFLIPTCDFGVPVACACEVQPHHRLAETE